MRVVTSQRTSLLRALAEDLISAHPGRVLRVGIDGVDGAGKTVFGDELAECIESLGRREVVRAGVDGFHHPRERRYRRGRESPEGFYLDSYDYDTMREVLLDPLSPGGDCRYRPAAFDHQANRPVDTPWVRAPADAVLIVDGIFLHRPELLPYWDRTVLLQVDFEVSIPRGAQRGFGEADPSAASNQRYVRGQQLYFERCRPDERATVIIDNNDLARPSAVRLDPTG